MDFIVPDIPGITEPTKAHQHDAGYDIYAPADIELLPFVLQKVETGLHLAIPRLSLIHI